MLGSVSLEKPAATSSQPQLATVTSAKPAPAVRRIAKFPTGPNGATWLIAVDEIGDASATGTVSLNRRASTPPLLDAFVLAYSLKQSLRAVSDAALASFGVGKFSLTRELKADAALGGYYVRVGIGAHGYSREEFKKKRQSFDVTLEGLPADPGFQRLVVVVSRSG